METNLTFGQALEALKQGRRISRKGWNGKNMFIFLNKGSVDCGVGETISEFTEGIRTDLFELGDTGTGIRLPNIHMLVATGSTLAGWLASQTDMLAEDWYILAY